MTKAQLYDAWIQHGYSDPGEDPYTSSANGMGDWVTKQLGGTPLTGVDELLWLRTYLAHRRSVLWNYDSTWRDSVSRVDIYSAMLAGGDGALTLPLHFEVDACCAGPACDQSKPSLCPLKAGQTGLRMGHVDYIDGGADVVWPGFTPWLQASFSAASLPEPTTPTNTACYKHAPGTCRSPPTPAA